MGLGICNYNSNSVYYLSNKFKSIGFKSLWLDNLSWGAACCMWGNFIGIFFFSDFSYPSFPRSQKFLENRHLSVEEK